MQSTWNFIKNNKKTIFFATSAVVGFIGLRKYFSQFEKQWEQSQSRSFVSEVHRKATYFEEALSIGNQMSTKQFKLILNKLKSLFHIVDLLEQIKNAQINKASTSEQLKYYEKLKIEILTYMISKIYCIVYLVVYLRIQLSMISGVMYYENYQINQNRNFNTNSGSSSQNNLLNDYSSRYYMFISLLENFHTKGIDHLVKFIRQHVTKSFDKMKVTDLITLDDLFKYFKEVQNQIEANSEQMIEENVLLVYCSTKRPMGNLYEQSSMPPDSTSIKTNQINSENTESKRILNELKACSKFVDEFVDIAKLPDFRLVLKNCIDIGFSNLFDFLSECFIEFDDRKKQREDTLENRHFINPSKIEIVLIKLLPLIWNHVHNDDTNSNNSDQHQSEFKNEMQKSNKTSNRSQNSLLLVQYLLCLDSLTCFTANIYEAFCNEK